MEEEVPYGIGIYFDDNSVEKNVKELIKKSKLDEKCEGTIGWKICKFENVLDNQNIEETLPWYLGNENTRFAEHIIEKVRKFQTSETTEIFKEINKKCFK